MKLLSCKNMGFGEHEYVFPCPCYLYLILEWILSYFF